MIKLLASYYVNLTITVAGPVLFRSVVLKVSVVIDPILSIFHIVAKFHPVEIYGLV
jgi:hypothetical protein